VTGGTSGIGIETARALASTGATLVLTARDLEKGHRVVNEIISSTGNTKVIAMKLDLADSHSVDAFISNWEGPLHIFVANAGVMQTPESYTFEGWELQFAINYLGHFALAQGLHAALAADGAARIVMVSSSGHGSSPILFDDLFFKKGPYNSSVAYGQSKTAEILFAVEATKRWRADGITANALMPGGIWTNLQKHWEPEVLKHMKSIYPGMTPQQGAATSVMLATSPILNGIGGRYFVMCEEAEVVPDITDGIHGVREYALNPQAAQKLWDVSLALLKNKVRQLTL
jgi:NAD(P)-dependent dehydrogenase (short-subunit alcohol dehydrogenase family)